MSKKYGQTKLMTIIESTVNVSSGLLLAFTISQLMFIYSDVIRDYIWQGFIWDISFGSNMLMTSILTIVSVIRGYVWRRIFNHHHVKRIK